MQVLREPAAFRQNINYEIRTLHIAPCVYRFRQGAPPQPLTDRPRAIKR